MVQVSGSVACTVTGARAGTADIALGLRYQARYRQ